MILNNKYYSLFIIVSLILVIALIIYKWESPKLNIKSQKSILDCINTSSNMQQVDIFSVNSHLKIKLATGNSSCIAPHFPSIQIEADQNQKHSAWIQIVHTDCKLDNLKIFIDANKDDWPFYNYIRTLEDSPLWIYNLWSKPISYWEAHAYSVNISGDTIKCLGGVKWGFLLSNYKLRPIITPPSALSVKDFQRDMKMVKQISNFPYKTLPIN